MKKYYADAVSMLRFSFSWKTAASVALGIMVVLFLLRSCVAGSDRNLYLYHVGRDPYKYPFAQFDKGKNMLGFANDVMLEIAAEEEIRITLLNEEKNALRQSLDHGSYDAILAAIIPTANLKEKYEFSETIYPLGPVLVVRKNSPIQNLEEMNGKVVGIVSSASLMFNIDRYPSLIVRNYENSQQALSSLDRDVIDGVILDFLSAYSFTSGIYSNKLRIATKPLTDEGLRLVARKRSRGAELIKYFNEGLATLKEKKEYDRLIQKWDLYSPLGE